ncbi:MAG: hypothetical protein EPO07_10770 [Verrucomicrobia bacterium]|nr:MAG: hypothetical protein EPO07_10770 [Verrucomicrobiota bacterium]
MKKNIKQITLGTLAVLTLTVANADPNVFRHETSTKNGYSTWDSDLINVERVTQTGQGVYVAVLDTGLVPNWRDYFPQRRIATKLGRGFHQNVVFKAKNDDPCGVEVEVGQLRKTSWIGSQASSHGTHVTSTILGYFYRANADAAAGYVLPPIMIRGIAPEVTIIPVKVLSQYRVPSLPHCSSPGHSQAIVFGTDEMVAAGINYATDLALQGYRPMVINMSLGGDELSAVEKNAIDRAVTNGVIVVAAAGNSGDAGMHYPGAYAPVISAGSAGWTKEWLNPNGTPPPPRYRLWWLQSPFFPWTDISEPTPASEVYVSDFSSRELTGQQLDVLAPGSWVRGPFPGDPGYSHLPWHSNGIGDLKSHIGHANFFYVGGTSMATPHVASTAALLLQKNPNLNQAQVENILKSTALPIAPGSATVFDIVPTQAFVTNSWGANATGAGLIQADAAISAVP